MDFLGMGMDIGQSDEDDVGGGSDGSLVSGREGSDIEVGSDAGQSRTKEDSPEGSGVEGIIHGEVEDLPAEENGEVENDDERESRGSSFGAEENGQGSHPHPHEQKLHFQQEMEQERGLPSRHPISPNGSASPPSFQARRPSFVPPPIETGSISGGGGLKQALPRRKVSSLSIDDYAAKRRKAEAIQTLRQEDTGVDHRPRAEQEDGQPGSSRPTRHLWQQTRNLKDIVKSHATALRNLMHDKGGGVYEGEGDGRSPRLHPTPAGPSASPLSHLLATSQATFMDLGVDGHLTWGDQTGSSKSLGKLTGGDEKSRYPVSVTLGGKAVKWNERVASGEASPRAVEKRSREISEMRWAASREIYLSILSLSERLGYTEVMQVTSVSAPSYKIWRGGLDSLLDLGIDEQRDGDPSDDQHVTSGEEAIYSLAALDKRIQVPKP